MIEWIQKDGAEYEQVLKPFPSEHSCRLVDPGQFDKFARKNCAIKSGGKCIDVIFGIKNNKSRIQALRYKKSIWTAEAARSHCSSKGGHFEAARGKSLDELEWEFDSEDTLKTFLEVFQMEIPEILHQNNE